MVLVSNTGSESFEWVLLFFFVGLRFIAEIEIFFWGRSGSSGKFFDRFDIITFIDYRRKKMK